MPESALRKILLLLVFALPVLWVLPVFVSAGELQMTLASFSSPDYKTRPMHSDETRLAETVATLEQLREKLDAFHPVNDCQRKCRSDAYRRGDHCYLDYKMDLMEETYSNCIAKTQENFERCVAGCPDH